ncbi:rod-binding protein, partial [Acinetobacter baumannii]
DAVPESGLFSSDSEKVYRDMFDNQMAVNLSEKGGIGLAETMVRQLAPSAESQSLQASLRRPDSSSDGTDR